jgi:hypothetical protein
MGKALFPFSKPLMYVMIATTYCAPLPSHADMTFEKSAVGSKINIFGTIIKADAKQIAQREADFNHEPFPVTVHLNSTGGDIDAAMEIGRIIRRNNGSASVDDGAKCYSSCALIYIAAVSRGVSFTGVVGLHRPYFGASPQSRQTLERETPLMYQSVKDYVHEMGVQDGFYQVMINTEPSKMKVYGHPLVGRTDIQSIVPTSDPTHDEIETSYDARKRGISTMEMRSRKAEAEDHCSNQSVERFFECKAAVEWGLSERVYKERFAQRQKCFADEDQEEKILSQVKTNERSDHPIMLKREACIRDIMLAR